MSGCSWSNCAISRVISLASLPCTGTGKNRSRSVAAWAALAIAVASSAATKQARVFHAPCTGLLRFARTDNGRNTRIAEFLLVYLMPEKVKLETNCRWKTRKISSSGAATKKVPAATTPHSEPASAPEVKEARPTVSTWVEGDDVAIKGHRNSFQWAVTDTIANATRPGRARGSRTRKMIVSLDAPSTSAASS